MKLSLRGQKERIKGIYEDYPKPFWTLTMATFIDALGGALIYPFISLYITRRFGVSMTQVGLLFGIFSVASIFGSGLGGALADRLGRKRMLIWGLIISALSSISMGLAPTIEWFFVLVFFVGLFANIGGPARQAMVADLLPEKKRAEGYGIIRVVMNLAITIGPVIGGLLATRSFLYLFIFDAIISLIVAGIVFKALPETKPIQSEESEQGESFLQTLMGYGKIFHDRVFLLFGLGSFLMVLVYMQMNTTLPVYLRDVYDVSAQGYGAILSLNAGMVVLFQFSITRKIRDRKPMLMMALGTAFYAIGFSMYGIVSVYPMFLVAMVIITIGEMIVAPVGQALVAKMAPETMRGRYMAAFGFTYALSSMFGPLIAGLIIDNLDPRILWISAGIVGLCSMTIFLLLDRNVGDRESVEQGITEGAG